MSVVDVQSQVGEPDTEPDPEPDTPATDPDAPSADQDTPLTDEHTPATDPDAPASPAPPVHPRRPPLGVLALVAGGYLLIRALGVGIVQLVLVAQHSTRYSESPAVLGALRAWDAVLYLRLAHHGYPDPTPRPGTGSLDPLTVAFFPGYPSAIWVFSGIPGVSDVTAGIIVSALAGAAAAVLLFVLVTDLYDRRVGAIVVALWASQPMSIVLSMIYSESLFSALAFGSLLAARRRRWVLAGVLGALAGCVRSLGGALSAALVLYALWSWWKGEDGRRSRRFAVHAVGGTSIALIGTPLYVLLIGLRMGDPRAWFHAQETGWGARLDWGAGTFHQVVAVARESVDAYSVGCGLLVLGSFVLLGVAVAQKVWPGLLLYAALVMAQAFSSSVQLQSKPRFLVPVATFALPVALVLARAPRRTQILVCVVLGLLGLWFGSHSLTVWRYSI